MAWRGGSWRSRGGKYTKRKIWYAIEGKYKKYVALGDWLYASVKHHRPASPFSSTRQRTARPE